MLTNYVKRYSPALGRDMEYKTYGDKGKAVLVFPSQNGRFFDYENMGMVDSIADYIESGKIRLVCVDSIDGETWSNAGGDPRWRIEQHERWFHHVIDEVIPEQRRDGETFMVTGCSMGGYHAGNFFFRRPDIFDTLISLSGLYHASFFFGDYSDELVYNNSPLDFLTWMPDDHYYLDIYRSRRIICCVGRATGKPTSLTRPAASTPSCPGRTCRIGPTTGAGMSHTTGHGGESRLPIFSGRWSDKGCLAMT